MAKTLHESEMKIQSEDQLIIVVKSNFFLYTIKTSLPVFINYLISMVQRIRRLLHFRVLIFAYER